MENILSIQIGVLTGVITAIVVKILYEIYQKILLPWFQSIVYKGVIVDGEWRSKLELTPVGFVVNLKMDLKQSGHLVKGDLYASYQKTNGDIDQVKHLKIEGTISDSFLSLHYSPKSRKRISQGNYLLQVKRAGEMLSGKMMSLDNVKMEIMVYEEIEWERVIEK